MEKVCIECGAVFSKPSNNSAKVWQARKYCSRECQHKTMIGTPINKGIPLTAETRKKIADLKRGKHVGENSAAWKGGRVQKKCAVCGGEFKVDPYRRDSAKYCSRDCGYIGKDAGITSENEKIRKSKAYKDWRKSVFERDGYSCQDCGKRSGFGKAVILHADHIKPFYNFRELRLDISNGRTLCIDCHKKTPTYGRPKVNP